MFTVLKHLGARVAAFVRRRDFDRDFEQELDSHLTLLMDENVRRGMTPERARREALMRLGGAASLKEQHREIRGLPLVDTILQDVRFACRLMTRDRWFAAAVIAALALGIGANATGFTIAHAMFLRGLPFDQADRLYAVSWSNRSGRRSLSTYDELEQWRAQSRTFAGLAAYAGARLNISDDGALPEQANGSLITVNGFEVLRQQPLLGRSFAAGDARPGATPVVVIAHSLWKTRYGANSDVLGKSLRVNGHPATIVGVMPPGMQFPYDTAVWMPVVPTDPRQRPNARTLLVFGRLTEGTHRREALAEMSGIAQQLLAAYPDLSRTLVGVRVETFTERFIGGMGRPMTYMVMIAVIFVLLIACANVASLLLSRSGVRAREIAVRVAMGATRWRVVRQLLIESLLLAFIGGSLGLILAVAGVQAFAAAMQSSGLPFWITFTIDYVVIAYVAAICVLTAILFGFAPALHVSKTNTHDVLKEGGRGHTGTRRERRLGSIVVVSELALTIVLLASAGREIRTFMTLYAVDLGMDVDRLMTMRLELPESEYPTPEARRAFFDRLEPRLAAIPGVEAAAVTTGVPPLDGGERLLEVDGRPATVRPVHVSTVTISPRFFEVVGVPLLRGRAFDDRDGAPGAETVLVNEQLAARFFPGEDPIGKRLRFSPRDPPSGYTPERWRTIVGISGRVLHGDNSDAYVNAVVYLPFRQEAPGDPSLLVRSPLPAASVMDAVRREVRALDPDQPIVGFRTVAQVLADDRWWPRTFGTLFGTLAFIALAMSAVGLYAVTAYAVARRTQEFGVRMALGAQRGQVSWLVFKRGLVQLAIGLTLGLAGAWALGRVIGGLLSDIGPTDPVTYAAITILAAVSLAACLVPARRATRVDPVIALRAE